MDSTLRSSIGNLRYEVYKSTNLRQEHEFYFSGKLKKQVVNIKDGVSVSSNKTSVFNLKKHIHYDGFRSNNWPLILPSVIILTTQLYRYPFPELLIKNKKSTKLDFFIQYLLYIFPIKKPKDIHSTLQHYLKEFFPILLKQWHSVLFLVWCYLPSVQNKKSETIRICLASWQHTQFTALMWASKALPRRWLHQNKIFFPFSLRLSKWIIE